MSAETKGVVAVITNPDGDVVAEAADFDRAGYGGFTLQEAQAIRAKDGVRSRFAAGHLNGWLGRGMEGYFVDAFWRNAERAGYRLSVVPIGYDEAAE